MERILIARATFGRSERLYSSCPRARSRLLWLHLQRALAIFTTSPLPAFFFGCEGRKLEESELCCVGFFCAVLLGRGSGCEAVEPDARMRRAAALFFFFFLTGAYKRVLERA